MTGTIDPQKQMKMETVDSTYFEWEQKQMEMETALILAPMFCGSTECPYRSKWTLSKSYEKLPTTLQLSLASWKCMCVIFLNLVGLTVTDAPPVSLRCLAEFQRRWI